MLKRKATTISIVQLLDWLKTEDDAVRWLESVVWGDRPVCPVCASSDKAAKIGCRKHYYHCADCRKQFSVKTNTIMHGSNTPVRKWLIAIYYLLTARKGISSLQLSKELQVTQKTAWFMLHRIRQACADGEFELSGIVEIDETYIGGKERNKHERKKQRKGRGGVGKQAVLGMRERGGKTKAKPIHNTDRATIQGEIGRAVEFGATIYTDDHSAYDRLHTGYSHGTVRHSAKEYVNGMAHTNGIESVWAVMKRGYNGIYHHWSAKHLPRYVNEFAFRLNEGSCDVDTLDRMNALCARIVGRRLTYAELIR